MIVAYSRPIAIKIYQKFIELMPEWKNGFIDVVMTKTNKDPEQWKKILSGKTKKRIRNFI